MPFLLGGNMNTYHREFNAIFNHRSIIEWLLLSSVLIMVASILLLLSNKYILSGVFGALFFAEWIWINLYKTYPLKFKLKRVLLDTDYIEIYGLMENNEEFKKIKIYFVDVNKIEILRYSIFNRRGLNSALIHCTIEGESKVFLVELWPFKKRLVNDLTIVSKEHSHIDTIIYNK